MVRSDCSTSRLSDVMSLSMRRLSRLLTALDSVPYWSGAKCWNNRSGRPMRDVRKASKRGTVPTSMGRRRFECSFFRTVSPQPEADDERMWTSQYFSPAKVDSSVISVPRAWLTSSSRVASSPTIAAMCGSLAGKVESS